jgi:hypothetical protein
LSFHGAEDSWSGDYVSIDEAASDIINPMTVETWVNVQQLPAISATILNKTGPPANNSHWQIDAASGVIRAYYLSGVFGEETAIRTGPAVVVGEWVHVAFVISGTSMTLFINGAQYGSPDTTIPATMVVPAGPIVMGQHAPLDVNTSTRLNGYVGLARIWNVARTGPQILADMNNYLGAGNGPVWAQDSPNLIPGSGTVTLADMDFLDSTREPQISLQVSKDNGKTWGYEQWRGMGSIGAYRTRVNWKRLGVGRDFLFKFRVTDPVKFTVSGGALRIE